MKIISKTIVLLFLVVGALTSCNNPISAPRTQPTVAFETAVSFVETTVAETKAALPTSTPSPTSIPTLTPFPEREMRVYTDPEGRYTITFPADWEPTDKPNSFSGNGGFFETGYLPEMGYVTRAITTCVWFANVEAEPEESEINWMPQDSKKCSVISKSNGYLVDYSIMENPGADAEHRFVYLKTGTYPSNPYNKYAYFSWTKSVYYQTKVASGIVPLSPTEAIFWGTENSMPSNISVTEYALPPEAQVGPREEMLLSFVPKEAQPDWEAMRKNASTSPKEPTVEEQLKSLGYELKGDIKNGQGLQLFRNSRLLFDHVIRVSNVYTFSTDSAPITAFVVNTRGTGGEYQHSFLIQNDAINVWEYGSMDYNYAPILYQDELLWAKVNQNSQVEIKKSNREVVFTFETYFDAKLHMDNFKSWNDHWILEADSFVVQDGEILNKKFNYQEVFDWSLVKNKPTYFFRKGSRIGISHGGEILPIQYQDVAHGLCCGFASNNPYISDDAIRFFGKRDGIWYYVVVNFE